MRDRNSLPRSTAKALGLHVAALENLYDAIDSQIDSQTTQGDNSETGKALSHAG
jgi:hypothetical protein